MVSSAYIEQHIPHYQEAEEATVGGILISPSTMDEIASYLKPPHFYTLRIQYIYDALLHLYRNRIDIDHITVCNRLREMDKLDEVSEAYVMKVTELHGNSLSAPVHAQLVFAMAKRRELLTVADKLSEMAVRERDFTVEDVIQKAQADLYDLGMGNAKAPWATMPELLSKLYDDLETGAFGEGGLVGLSTGFKRLDNQLLGLIKGKSYIFAGRPSMGKSAFIQQLALNVALQCDEENRPRLVIVFSQEMPSEGVVIRMVSSQTKIPAMRIQSRRVDQVERDKVTHWMGRIGLSSHLVVNDTPNMTPAKMIATVREAERRYGQNASLVVEDYLQLMVPGVDDRNREQEVAYVSRGLKTLAMECDVPVVSAAQINRDVEHRQDKRPTLADLRESGAIENDADMVAFLYREDYYDKDPLAYNPVSDLELMIAKHRDGPTGTLGFTFDRPHMYFVEKPN